ncbi:ATP-binding protein [Kitasatospora griseola]|uniref:ATP-binding protein n=1 Tax=Kitasatospora griseola TaxID=2064 RepID=UPI003422CF4C
MTSTQAPTAHPAATTLTGSTWSRRHQPTGEEDVPILRAAIADFCLAWGGRNDRPIDDLALYVVVLVATELISNAIRHAAEAAAGGKPSVAACIHILEDGRVLVSVADRSSSEPVPKLADQDDENGRGLKIIHDITGDNWGWHPLPGGKSIWAICPSITTSTAA